MSTSTSSEDAERLFLLSRHQEELIGELDRVLATTPVLQPRSFSQCRGGAELAEQCETHINFHSKI